MTQATFLSPVSTVAKTSTKPKLGFLGVGWIGLNRLEALVKAGICEVAAVADPSREMAARAGAIVPQAALKRTLDDLLESGLDGLVIATPSALHAEQAIRALENGVAVFCQKPLGRSGEESAAVVEAARQADRLLGVDLSYRYLSGAQRLRELVQGGELGRVFAIETIFHNAYGPDKPWFYDRKLSGGGCVIDLGIHLVDLALWLLGFPEVVTVSSRLLAKSEPWNSQSGMVEDYAVARLDLASGATVQLGCSWKLPAGREAVIEFSVYGTAGGAGLHNVNGSFYEFKTEQFQNTTRRTLNEGLEPWGGRALIAWTEQLARRNRFDPEVETVVQVARVLDEIYAQKGQSL